MVTGNGDVSIGSRLAATGDGGATAGDGTVLYAVTDRISSLLPRGNASGATVANFTTGYMVADNATAEPDTNPSGASCTSRNSGSICAVSAPYQGSSKSATSYTYNDFGEKLTTAIPKAQYETPPIGQTSTYNYTYYPTGSTDLSGTVSTEGWLEAVTDPASNFVAFAYDQAGNVVRSWDRNTTAGAANPAAFLAAPEQSVQPDPTREQSTALPWRYVLSQTDPLGNTTRYTVDQEGNRLSVTSPRSNTTSQQFDAGNNLTQRNTPLEGSTPAKFHYDQFGSQDWSQTPNGAYTVRSYDTVNRLTTSYADSGPLRDYH